VCPTDRPSALLSLEGRRQEMLLSHLPRIKMKRCIAERSSKMYEGGREIEKRQNFSCMHMMHHAKVLWNPLAGRWTPVSVLFRADPSYPVVCRSQIFFPALAKLPAKRCGAGLSPSGEKGAHFIISSSSARLARVTFCLEAGKRRDWVMASPCPRCSVFGIA